MNIRRLYLALALLGLFIPNSAFWSWLRTHGLDPERFVQDLFSNGVSAFFGLDVILSALVLSAFVLIEGKRLGLRRRWLPDRRDVCSWCFARAAAVSVSAAGSSRARVRVTSV